MLAILENIGQQDKEARQGNKTRVGKTKGQDEFSATVRLFFDSPKMSKLLILKDIRFCENS